MDKYDKQIEEIKSGHSTIKEDWYKAKGLFAFATDCKAELSSVEATVGCLVMIRNSSGIVLAQDQELAKKLTNEILLDKRLPRLPEEIKEEHLPVFAEWQRRLDKEIRNA